MTDRIDAETAVVVPAPGRNGVASHAIRRGVVDEALATVEGRHAVAVKIQKEMMYQGLIVIGWPSRQESAWIPSTTF